MIKIQNSIYISPDEIQFRYSRSSGPGGQKLNKTNSRVELIWSFLKNKTFNPQEVEQLKSHLRKIITSENLIIVSSETYRTQLMNRQSCVDKLCQLVINALHIDKKRVKTKPGKNEKKRRLESKKQHSEKKKGRKKISDY